MYRILSFLLLIAVSISAEETASIDAKPLLLEIGRIQGNGVTELGGFRTSGEGGRGYPGLLESGGSMRNNFTFEGTLSGQVEGTIQRAMQSIHLFVNKRSDVDVWIMETNTRVQWKSEAGHYYEIDVRGSGSYSRKEIARFLTETLVLRDQDIYWIEVGHFRTTNPALSRYNERLVLMKIVDEMVDPETYATTVNGILYAIVDPVDTWDAELYSQPKSSSEE